MLRIHPNARTSPAVRAEIARSGEPSGALAKRYGVSAETVRKWRKRGPEDCLDRSARPHRLPWKATDEERAVVCALRRSTDFALGDLTSVVAHFLPQLRTADGGRRKRYLYVAIDRRSRSVHLAAKDDETERSAVAFLREAAAAFPFRLTHVPTGNGSCFTPAFARACAELGAEYRHTRPYSPHTNGMVERFNGRVGSEVLAITIWSHQQLERLLRGFNAACNARRQRVLDGKTPDQVVAERLRSRRRLAKPKPEGGAGTARAERNRTRRDAIADARLIAEAAKDVSPPDIYHYVGTPGLVLSP